MAGPVFSVDLVGLRDVRGRFARAADEGLRRHATEQAGVLASELRQIFHDRAPRGETGKFADSFTATVAPSAEGFTLEVKSSQPDIRRWIRYGTGVFAESDDSGHRAVGAGDGGAIVPLKASALHWSEGGQEYFRRVVQGMRPRKWEDAAVAASKELARVDGQKFVARVLR